MRVIAEGRGPMLQPPDVNAFANGIAVSPKA